MTTKTCHEQTLDWNRKNIGTIWCLAADLSNHGNQQISFHGCKRDDFRHVFHFVLEFHWQQSRLVCNCETTTFIIQNSTAFVIDKIQMPIGLQDLVICILIMMRLLNSFRSNFTCSTLNDDSVTSWHYMPVRFIVVTITIIR